MLLHVPGAVVVRQAWRLPGEEHRVRLQGQLVMRDMGRLQGEGALQVVFGHRQVLAGQGVHQVQVEVVEARVLGQFHRAFGLGAVMDASEAFQAAVVEALDLSLIHI